MFTPQEMIWGLAVPFGVSVVVVGALGGWKWGVGLGLAAAYVAGYVGVFGLPGVEAVEGVERPVGEVLRGLWPDEASEWAVVAAMAAGLVGLTISCGCVSDGAAWLGRLLLTFGLVNAVLWPMVGQWETGQALVYVQAIAAIVLVAWWSLDELAERQRGGLFALVMTLSTGLGSLLLLSASQVIGSKLLVLFAALAGAWLVGLVRGGMTLARGGVAVAVGVFATLLICGAFYAHGVAHWALLTVGLAPLAAWVGEVRPVVNMRPLGKTLVVSILVLIPLAIAVAPPVVKMVRASQAPAETQGVPRG